MLQPDYRGLIFNNENQKITLSVSLDSVSNKGGYLLLTRIDDSSGVLQLSIRADLIIKSDWMPQISGKVFIHLV